MSKSSSDRFMLALLAAAGVSSGAILLMATRWGIGVSYDSVFYLSAADNLLHGLGLSRLGGGGEIIPLTHFPPLYPLVLAAGGWIAPVSTSVVARLLAAALLPGLVVLTGLLVKEFTNSAIAAAGTALVVLSSPIFLEVDAWAMSEALYLVCLLGALGWLARYMSEPTWRGLFWAALLTGAAYATRYVGASLLVTGLVVVSFADDRPWTSKVRRLLAYGVVSGIPVALWMGRNILLTGLTTNRSLVFHPLGRDKLSEAAHSLAGWLLPDAITFRLRLAITLIVLAGLGWFWLRRWWQSRRTAPLGWDRATKLAALAGLHMILYGALLITSLSFLDASTRLDDRILSPVWLLIILMGGLAAGRWLSARTSTGWPVWSVAVLAAGLVVSGGVKTWDQAKSSYDQGLGFNSRAWVSSPTVAWVRSLDANASLTSNEAFPLYYLTGRPVYWAPEAIDPVKDEPRPELPDELRAMRSRLASPDAYLVIFHPNALRVEMPPLADLTQGLVPVLKTSDADVYTGK